MVYVVIDMLIFFVEVSLFNYLEAAILYMINIMLVSCPPVLFWLLLQAYPYLVRLFLL